jgi:hypothetical protein
VRGSDTVEGTVARDNVERWSREGMVTTSAFLSSLSPFAIQTHHCPEPIHRAGRVLMKFMQVSLLGHRTGKSRVERGKWETHAYSPSNVGDTHNHD